MVTRRDELGRRTVFQALPAWVLRDGWVPVGRLDRDTRGLLLFLKKPQCLEALSSPGSRLKSYEVWVRGRPAPGALETTLTGVRTAIGILRFAEVEVLGFAGPKTRLRVVLDEGKNRQIRRVFGALRDPERGTSLKVLDLKRTSFGPVLLDLPSGAWRFLSEGEHRALLPGEPEGPVKR